MVPQFWRKYTGSCDWHHSIRRSYVSGRTLTWYSWQTSRCKVAVAPFRHLPHARPLLARPFQRRFCAANPAVRLSPLFLILYAFAIIASCLPSSGVSAQHCAESNLVAFPGFRCCKEPLDSESGWRWICFRHGEIPTEPPEVAETTTASATPDATPPWTSTVSPQAVEDSTSSRRPSPSVTPAAVGLDSTRTSKSVKTSTVPPKTTTTQIAGSQSFEVRPVQTGVSASEGGTSTTTTDAPSPTGRSAEQAMGITPSMQPSKVTQSSPALTESAGSTTPSGISSAAGPESDVSLRSAESGSEFRSGSGGDASVVKNYVNSLDVMERHDDFKVAQTRTDPTTNPSTTSSTTGLSDVGTSAHTMSPSESVPSEHHTMSSVSVPSEPSQSLTIKVSTYNTVDTTTLIPAVTTLSSVTSLSSPPSAVADEVTSGSRPSVVQSSSEIRFSTFSSPTTGPTIPSTTATPSSSKSATTLTTTTTTSTHDAPARVGDPTSTTTTIPPQETTVLSLTSIEQPASATSAAVGAESLSSVPESEQAPTIVETTSTGSALTLTQTVSSRDSADGDSNSEFKATPSASTYAETSGTSSTLKKVTTMMPASTATAATTTVAAKTTTTTTAATKTTTTATTRTTTATPAATQTPTEALTATSWSSTLSELRSSTSSLAQVTTTTPTPVTLLRSRRDSNRLRLEDFLQKMGLEESEPALEIEYARRPHESLISIQCNTASPNIRALFMHLGVKDVASVRYTNCEVPTGRLKFVHIFENNSKNITRLELNRPSTVEGVLSTKVFDGVAASLTELRVTSSASGAAPAVTGLSDDFFNSFASLTVLGLKSNALERLPSSIKTLKKLKTLDLSMNLITTVTSDMFIGLESLTTLYLGKNPIVRFEAKPFSFLKRLTVLELTAAQVNEVPEDLFEGLSSLLYLNMNSWRKLKSLPAKLFHETPRLETLYLSEASAVGSLPDGLFDGMFRLNATFIRSCNFTSLPKKLFASAVIIKIIDLSGNALPELPESFFAENAKLESLLLANNKIQTLKNEFEMLYALKELNLRNNQLSEISSRAFENLISLQTLDLSRNRISKIEKNALYHLKKLEKLDIRDNQLTSFGGHTPTFSTGSPIREVYLSRNRLASFPHIQFQALPKLAILDLDDNEIQFFAVPLFASMDTKVFLRRNRLEYISVELAKSYPKQDSVYNSAVGTHRFDVGENLFKCDCNIYNFVRYLRKEMKPEVAEFEHAEQYRCADRDEVLLSVKLDMLSCRTTDCPPGCECFLRAHDASLHVRCRELGLPSLPKLPFNVTHLDFEGNVLKRYPGELASYKNLKEVILDGNNIDNIDELFINPPASLQLLSLTGNRLEVLQPITANTSFRMTLSNNPWICDCSALDFKRFVRSNIANIPDYRSIACKNVYVVNGTEVSLLNDIPDDVFCPPDVSAYRASVIALAIVFALLLLLIALYYRNRQLIIAYMYIHFYNVFVCFFNEGNLDEDKKFDAFVSYSSNDRDVVMALLQELEKPQGDESSENLFRLCIHERDWLPGYNISWNIVNSVQNSRRTILVLSQDFLKSLWFEVEFRTAYVQMMEDRINRLIIIIKDEIPPKDTLDADLRFLLGTKTYLEWGEKWFWEKLKYAMPHKGNLQGPLANKIKPSELHKVLPMNVITSKNQMPNSETVVRVEDAIESAQSNRAGKRVSPDDSTYGSMSESLPSTAKDNSGKMGHLNRAYEPVSTEDIHSICLEPDPGVSASGQSAASAGEPKPVPRFARRRDSPESQPTAARGTAATAAAATAANGRNAEAAQGSSPRAKPAAAAEAVSTTPVKSARVKHSAQAKLDTAVPQ